MPICIPASLCVADALSFCVAYNEVDCRQSDLSACSATATKSSPTATPVFSVLLTMMLTAGNQIYQRVEPQ